MSVQNQWEKIDQYTTSLYWSITTMTTIGYGDITPKTTVEKCVTMITMITGCSIFAYGVTNIVTLVAHLNYSSHKFKEEMDNLNEWLGYRHVCKPLRMKIREFFLYKHHAAMLWNEHGILMHMSESLRNEILLHIHSNLAKKVPFMRDNLEKQERFVCSVLLKLQPDQCAPGDTVIHMGDVGTHMFIVERGCLEAYINETTVVKTFDAGDYFGEFAVLQKRPSKRTASIRGKTWCDLLKLDRQDFIATLRQWPAVEKQIRSDVDDRLKEAIAGLKQTDHDVSHVVSTYSGNRAESPDVHAHSEDSPAAGSGSRAAATTGFSNRAGSDARRIIELQEELLEAQRQIIQMSKK